MSSFLIEVFVFMLIGRDVFWLAENRDRKLASLSDFVGMFEGWTIFCVNLDNDGGNVTETVIGSDGVMNRLVPCIGLISWASFSWIFAMRSVSKSGKKFTIDKMYLSSSLWLTLFKLLESFE